MKHIGAVIQQIRKKRRMTQDQLATKCDVTRGYITDIEIGKKNPSKKMLSKLSSALNTPIQVISWMTMDENDVAVDKRKDFKMILPTVNALIKEFFNLTPIK